MAAAELANMKQNDNHYSVAGPKGALDRSMRPAKLSLVERARELAALDRYERRALSRRKFAIRAYVLARLEAERRARDAVAASYGGVEKIDCYPVVPTQQP
jgi:hypothetical protein